MWTKRIVACMIGSAMSLHAFLLLISSITWLVTRWFGSFSIASSNADDLVDGHPGLRNQLHQRQQQLPTLVLANCSIAAAAVFSSRLMMWYGFFTAVVSFRRMVLANRFYRTGPPPPLSLQLRLGHPRRRVFRQQEPR